MMNGLDSHMVHQVKHTEYAGHAAVLATEAIAEGCEVLIPVGGDGTINEVVNGIISAPEDRRPAVAVCNLC